MNRTRPPLRTSVIVLVIAGLMVGSPVAAQPRNLPGSGAGWPATATRDTAATTPDQGAADGVEPFIDRNLAVISCLFGTAIGFAMVNFSPIAGWSYYEGWPIGTWAMASRGGLGCYFGMVVGIAASAVRSTGHTLGAYWAAAYEAVVGPPERPFVAPAPLTN